MTDLFIGDPQLWHHVTATHRGYSSIEAHDGTVLRNWRKHVNDGDNIWVVGDAAMGEAGWKAGIEVFRDLPGVKHLILGNHDRAHPCNKNGHRYVKDYLEVFDSVALHASVRHQGLEFMVSHHPYDGDHTSHDRQQQWRLRDHGVPIIHGHIHSDEKVSRSAAGTLQINTCLEAWGMRPALIGDIAALVHANTPT